MHHFRTSSNLLDRQASVHYWVDFFSSEFSRVLEALALGSGEPAACSQHDPQFVLIMHTMFTCEDAEINLLYSTKTKEDAGIYQNYRR